MPAEGVLTADALGDPATFTGGVPHALFARLRRERPVAWVDAGFWAVTRHADISAASRDTALFSSQAQGAFLHDVPGGRRMLVDLDGDRHRDLRRVLTPLFTPRAVGGLRESVRAHARRLVEAVVGAGEVDVVADLAAELPLLVLCDLLGVPAADRALMLRWSNALVGFDDPRFGGAPEAQRAVAGLYRYAVDLAEDQRRRGRDDLVGRMASALSVGDFCALLLLLVVAGNETTRHLIGNGLHVLAAHPAERDRLVADPGLTSSAVAELVRWITPISQFRRTATRDCVLADQPVRRGDRVVLYFASANRDETVVAEPDRLDLGRTPNPHLAFGAGPHYCLGAHLAALEVTVLLDELRPHLRGFEPLAEPTRLASTFVNGVTRFPARFR
ncbi:cytochrome P450 [Actinosynnema sp. NPDC020468]|uniref:cytochrome P450 n=1 Tax=Actinosynnema sp. NPDC020468 TaxID=3154488 RepID=UPI0033E533EE